MGFTRNDEKILHHLMGACSVLSILGSSLIILFYLRFTVSRSRSAKLVVWLSITDIILCASVITFVLLPNQYETPVVNEIFACILSFQILAGVFWACSVTKTMSLVILQRDKLLGMLSNNSISPKKLAVKRMIKFHILIWSSCTILALLPFFFGAYRSYKFSWYWFKTDFRSQVIAITCFFLPLLIGFGYNFYILLAMGQVKQHFLSAESSLENGDTLASELYTLVMSLKNYPIVSMVVSLLLLLLQVVRMSLQHVESGATLWLHVLSAMVQLSQGILYFTAYMYAAYRNRHRRRALARLNDHEGKTLVKDLSSSRSGAAGSRRGMHPLMNSVAFQENPSGANHSDSQSHSKPLLEKSSGEDALDIDAGFYVEQCLDGIWKLLFGHNFHSEHAISTNSNRWDHVQYRVSANGDDSININAIASRYYDPNGSYRSGESMFSHDGLFSNKLRQSDESSQSAEASHLVASVNGGSTVDRRPSGDVVNSRTNSVVDNVRLSNVCSDDRLKSTDSDQLCRSLLEEFN